MINFLYLTGLAYSKCISDPTKCGCAEVNLSDYRGTIAVTSEGATCQAWLKQTPNRHDYKPYSKQYKHEGLDENYCRNPFMDGQRPWCYTVDGESAWGYCDVDTCDSDDMDIPPECRGNTAVCSCEGTQGRYYNGIIHRTRSGSECIDWSKVVDSNDIVVYADIDGSYCRNPDGAKEPWCYVDTQGTKEYCDIPKCGCDYWDPSVCGCTSTKQADYRGKINKSQSGILCQKWSEQYPNTHIYNPANSDYRPQGLESNFCRNPDSEGDRAWCYLSDTSHGRWEYCDIPICDQSTTSTTTTTTTTTTSTTTTTTTTTTSTTGNNKVNKYRIWINDGRAKI